MAKRAKTFEKAAGPPPSPKKWGYARVSTSDQDMRMQRDALIAAGVDQRDIFEETASGASLAKRRQFNAMMKELVEGDTLYVWKLDRLARSAVDLYDTARIIEQRGASLVVLTMPGMDTRHAMGKAMFGMLAVFAEFERALSYERTMAGLKAARERGKWGGRRSVFTDEQVLAVSHLPVKAAAYHLGMKSTGGYSKRLAKAMANEAAKMEAQSDVTE
jgi:DNA invertase Pin-like site-specific DNA recombinase